LALNLRKDALFRIEPNYSGSSGNGSTVSVLDLINVLNFDSVWTRGLFNNSHDQNQNENGKKSDIQLLPCSLAELSLCYYRVFLFDMNKAQLHGEIIAVKCNRDANETVAQCFNSYSQQLAKAFYNDSLEPIGYQEDAYDKSSIVTKKENHLYYITISFNYLQNTGCLHLRNCSIIDNSAFGSDHFIPLCYNFDYKLKSQWSTMWCKKQQILPLNALTDVVVEHKQ